jgi:3-hydroxy acid dehydrogenase/malonic semialdehyde reductase
LEKKDVALKYPKSKNNAAVQYLHYYRILKPTIAMSLKNQNIIITGASMGIGATTAKRLAAESANLILFARSEDKLKNIAEECRKVEASIKVHSVSVDVSNPGSLRKAVANAVNELGPIDVLINNAGLAIGAPNRFPDLTIDQITTMSGTNINGFMFATYAALNEGKMKERNKGTILNVTSTTGLEVPPFPGEAVYHASKAFQEAFSNVLRTELVGTDIKVLALRPGVTATNFHELRCVDFSSVELAVLKSAGLATTRASTTHSWRASNP